MQSELVDVIPVGNTLGEGVSWDSRTGLLWWTDIHEAKLYRLRFETRSLEIFALPEKLGSFGLTEKTDVFIGAFASGFYLFNPETAERSLIELTCAALPGIRMNDGRLDPDGRFWAGSMVEDEALAAGQKGCLYAVEKGVVRRYFSGVGISNGLSWSRAGDRMYFADTPERAIMRYRFDRTAGEISDPQIFAGVPDGGGADGAVVDSEDHYWSAQWGLSRVARYAPDGALTDIIEVPAPHVACVEFGGPELNHLFVTTAKWEMAPQALNKHDQAGHLFVYKTSVKGVALRKFYSLT